MKETIITHSPEETEGVGELLCRALLDMGYRQAFVALRGDMGVGKTAFSRGFGKALGISGVKSPTYTIVSEHRGNPLPLFHFDMYRIEGGDDLWSIGFEDYLQREGYILCEWSERIDEDIPEGAIYVTLSKTPDEYERTIEIEGTV